MTEQLLFIGGSADGQRRWVPDSHPTMQHPKRRGPIFKTGDPLAQEVASIEFEVYVPSYWGTQGDGKWTVYVVEGMSTKQAFEKLLAGYKPEGADEPGR